MKEKIQTWLHDLGVALGLIELTRSRRAGAAPWIVYQGVFGFL
jgi:hypothetical protein